MKLLVILVLIVLVGCDASVKHQKVICEDWESPLSYIARIDNGSIRWYVTQPDFHAERYNERKMRPGEICRMEYGKQIMNKHNK